jgi:2-polyprenyl-6-methoxyphenol hydroxylase-like FAD-dependent oxidoreductase
MIADVLVVGGGVAGCAAAVASARAGARTALIEAAPTVGGVAVAGEHRTLCGLAAIDAPTAALLEPGLVGDWLPTLASGAPYRQGRVWLWPTTAAQLRGGLVATLAAAGVAVRLGWPLVSARYERGRFLLRVPGEDLAAAVVVDASGQGACATMLGGGRQEPGQWPAHRSVLALPDLGLGKAARIHALSLAHTALGESWAMALTPMGGMATDAVWQLSLDVPPGTAPERAAACAERIAQALNGSLLACACRIASRDEGRPAAVIGLEELFAERARGLCWAAWPQEEHGADGVLWRWPAADRHGVPERAMRPLGAPPGFWCIGKGSPVSPAAAAALRVTGTCLAAGTAIGRLAAHASAAAISLG